jgi:hypothetical protein
MLDAPPGRMPAAHAITGGTSMSIQSPPAVHLRRRSVKDA